MGCHKFGMLFWREGEYLVDLIHQRIDVSVQESVQAVSARRRVIESHQTLVALVEDIESMDFQFDEFVFGRDDGLYADNDDEARQQEASQQQSNGQATWHTKALQIRHERTTDIGQQSAERQRQNQAPQLPGQIGGE